MRLLGLDLGTKTLGVAISDKTGLLASSLETIRFSGNQEELLKPLQKLIEQYQIEKVVLGLPKNMDGSLGFAAQRSQDFASLFERHFSVPLILVDERLTTVEAENNLRFLELNHEKRKKLIDGEAARIILESYMEKERNSSYGRK